MRNRRAISMLSLVLFCIFMPAVLCFSGEQIYPPYPDIWGYELPWPAEADRNSQIQGIVSPDGDIVFTYVKARIWKKVQGGSKELSQSYSGLYFFSGLPINFTNDEYNTFLAAARKHEKGWGLAQGKPAITLSDGTSIAVKGQSIANCADPFDHYIEVRDIGGKVLRREMVVFAPEKPVPLLVDRKCERNWDLKKEKIDAKIIPVYPRLILLRDDTFLLFDQEANFIVRFERNMTTRSPLVGRSIFVISRAIFEDLRSKLQSKGSLYNDDTANKALYGYIKRSASEKGRR